MASKKKKAPKPLPKKKKVASKKPAPKKKAIAPKKAAPKKKAAAPKKKAAAPKKKAAAPKKAAPKKPAGGGAIVQEIRFLGLTPEQIFDAYTTSDSHSKLTGAKANIDAEPGSTFDAWDGYILGTNLELARPSRIVQAWRTTEFPEGHPDSRLELLLTSDGDDTVVRLVQTGVPEDQIGSYEKGWHEYYWDPIRRHFSAG